MKITYFLSILFFLFWVFLLETSALTGDTSPEKPIEFCSNNYEITGEEKVKVGSTHEYGIAPRSDGVSAFTGNITFHLIRDEKIVEEILDTRYIRNFKASGNLRIEASLSSLPLCEGILTKNITVYESSVFYLGESIPEIEGGMKDVFEKNSILFQNFQEDALRNDVTREGIIQALVNADTIIIGSSDLLSTFSEFSKMQKSKSVDFSQKRIVIRSDYSRSFLSKLLAFSLSEIGAKRAFLVTKEGFYGLITRLSSGIPENEQNLGEELSYEKSGFVVSLGGFLEYLSYSGFSYSLIAFLLTLTVAVLLLNIMKQIIGLNVFGIYYPILFAIILSILGLSSLSFIVIGFLSIMLVNLFTRKVHLLINAKRALLISLYIVLFFFLIGIDNFFELKMINYSLFHNSLIVFPIFIAVILADKIFQDEIDLGKRGGIVDFFQYIIITLGVYFLLQSTALQYVLISYPDIIIGVVILNILVGRYMGLQVLEYFRFSPLLRRMGDQEEE